jgi:hypothetical protein
MSMEEEIMPIREAEKLHCTDNFVEVNKMTLNLLAI